MQKYIFVNSAETDVIQFLVALFQFTPNCWASFLRGMQN